MNAQMPSCLYEIHVEGVLPAAWKDYLDGFRLVSQENGTSTLRGPVLDQSALLGMLEILQQMDVCLLAVRPLPHEAMDSHDI